MGTTPNSPINAQCPKCGAIVRAGELVCHNCGTALNGATITAATRALEKAEETFQLTRNKTIGSALGKPQKVILVVDGQEAIVPVGAHLVIGRLDQGAIGPSPDVDLSQFDAENLGVSRQHVELSWRNGLFYVADMGSTNGTLLNGQRLVAGIERILRDNDQLIIGHLRALVRLVNT